MTTQAEMREMRGNGASEKEMAAHVRSSGGYNGVANGYAGDGRGGGSSNTPTPTAPLAVRGPIETRIRGTIEDLSKAGRDA